MRPPRVVAGAALIAVLASVAVSGTAGSHTPSRETPIDPGLFMAVTVDGLAKTATTTSPRTLDPDRAEREQEAILFEPARAAPLGASQPTGVAPVARPIVVDLNPWHHDQDESWYGPSFFGQRTACGQLLTQALRGVASRTLPCGTRVQFRNPANGAVITVPVVDRGPYVAGRQWDLTYGACSAIGHCWTGPLDWRFP
ncbi:MAG TPA: septal ring lytic transglycosylase RlpA family protein [Candidatus Limnocylindrales bacterium]|nr:septal ring lytic transglycosylase RlpA family protein [Candidatus Limnocylindrales bacterium]